VKQGIPERRGVRIDGHAIQVAQNALLLAAAQPGYHADAQLPVVETILVADLGQFEPGLKAGLPIVGRAGRAAEQRAHASDLPAIFLIGVQNAGHLGIAARDEALRIGALLAAGHKALPEASLVLRIQHQAARAPRCRFHLARDGQGAIGILLWMGDGDGARAPDGDRLKALGPHDGAKAPLTSRRAGARGHRGDAAEVFARRANGHDPGIAAKLLSKAALGGQGAQAGKIARIAQLHLTIVDP